MTINAIKRTSALAMVGLVYAALASGVWAQEAGAPRVVIFPLESSLPADQHPGLARELTSRLVAESKQRGMRVTKAQASFTDTMFIAGCASPSQDCYERILDQLGAERGVTGRIEPAGEDGQVRVELVYFRRGGEEVTESFEAEAGAAPDGVAEVAPSLLGEGEGEDEDGGGSILPWSDDTSMSSSRVSWTSWAAIGGGGALMGTGVVFWVLASREQVRVDNARTDTAADLERLVAIEDSAQRRATIGNVLFVTGVTAAAIGTALALRQGLRSDSGAPPPEQESVSLAPVPLRGGMGLTLTLGWSP